MAVVNFEQRSKKSLFLGSGIFLLLMTALASSAWAADEGERTSPFTYSGFGTLGLVHSTESKADFAESLFQPDGAGHSATWAKGVDSLAGGQVAANVNDRLSAVLQVIVKERWDGRYKPVVEWANVKYAFTPDFSVRIGRIVLPSFLDSETRYVGFSNPWVRPPVEIFSMQPVTSSDGVDTSFRFRFGGVTNTIVALYGSDRFITTDGSVNHAKDLATIAYTMDYGYLTLHAAYLKTRLTIAAVADIPVPAIAALGTDAPGRFASIGANYDPGNWFVQGEFARVSVPGINGQMGWYGMGGYRWGKWTPYAIFSRQFQHGAVGLNPASPQKTESLGLRWDFMKKMDLKLQLDHIDLDSGSSGVFSNLQSGFQRGGGAKILSLTFDFVF